MARRKRLPDDEKPMHLNMTPMIDVVFQLLIFFMLSMHFKEVEGKLLSQLPKDKGLAPSPVLQPELKEVRIVICGGDIRMHTHDKGRHEKDDKRSDECRVKVEEHEIGTVYSSELPGGGSKSDTAKLARNKEIYKQLGLKTRELYNIIPSSRDAAKRPPVILDADSETPYEHIIGAVNACKEQGIENVEFVGNPRLDKYYGSYQKGQFDRSKK